MIYGHGLTHLFSFGLALLFSSMVNQALAQERLKGPSLDVSAGIFGTGAKVSLEGVMSYDHRDPQTNSVVRIDVQQTGVRSIPIELIEIITGRPMICHIWNANENPPTGDCWYFPGDVSRGSVSVLRELMKEYPDHYLGGD